MQHLTTYTCRTIAVLTLTLAFAVAACSTPTAPEVADAETDLVVDVRLACVSMHGTDRVQCDTEEEARQGAEDTNGEWGSMGSNGKFWYLPGLCTEDCT